MSVIIVGGQEQSGTIKCWPQLSALDKDLLAVWHHPPHWPKSRPGCWKIEQCIQHAPGAKGEHTHICRRTYVLMCQDEQGVPMPLCDRILEKLREMRANSERYGGATERGLQNFIRESNNIDETLKAKRDAKSEDVKRHVRRDNRVTLNRVIHGIEQHDVFRVNR